MKKVIFGLAALTLFFTSCENETPETVAPTQDIAVDMSNFYVYSDNASTDKSATNGKGKDCQSMVVLNRQLEENPGLYKKMYDIEYQTRKITTAKGKPGNGNGGGGGGTPVDPVDDGLGVLNIPVVVHVIYSNSQENISNAQVASQIAVLNEDFSASNGDLGLVPAEFAGMVGNSQIQFTLNYINRVASNRTSWGTRNEMKYASNGGADVVDPANNLNIWVCNIGGGILGYAQFPGGAEATDGVVISPQYFGNTGFVSAPFDQGRTATHEVGHYLNLRHIWGDGRCRQDDFVSDTPSSDGPNYGCPSYPTVNCKSNDMTMNYMDYTNDDCMYMFSEGQKQRMRALFTAGGPREALGI